jgi:hypothetical protein
VLNNHSNSFKSHACVLPATPALTCVRAFSNKEEDQFSSFVKCPRFLQRSGRDGKNLSRLSAALR